MLLYSFLVFCPVSLLNIHIPKKKAYWKNEVAELGVGWEDEEAV